MEKLIKGLEVLFNVLYNISTKVLVYISLVLFCMLAAINIVVTTYFNSTYAESSFYRIDNIFLFILMALVTVIVLKLIDHKIGIANINSKKLLTALMIFTFIFSAGWVIISHSYPVADRWYVAKLAKDFAGGDYNSLGKGGYLYKYPFQLGIITLVGLIYKVAGVGNYEAVQLCNAAAVCAVFFCVYRISKLLFSKQYKKLPTILLIMMFGCFAPMFFCTYVYGNLFGLAFITFALWMEIEYLDNRKVRYIVLAIIGATIGVILKNNYSIMLVAMVLMLLIDMFKTKRYINLLISVIMVLSYALSLNTMFAYYSNISGVKVNDGIPKIMWVAMGLQEGWFGRGSYNAYTVDEYENADYNSEIASQKAMGDIKARADEFVKNPLYAAEFFGEKLLYQWTEPTYMSIWDSNCSDNHTQELSEFTKSVYVGFWHNFFAGAMNFLQSLVWLCAFIFVFAERKRINACQMLLAMIIIGGMLFHMIWESKSQYILQYFILALPYGAGGMSLIINKVDVLRRKG